MIKNLEVLKDIFEKVHQPQLLDSHPWTRSLIVAQACADTPGLLQKSPGQQLIFAITKTFCQMKPVTPPRRGKRLDTRWGEFGILAAQYFAPLVYGESVPSSLREAWGYIDQSILLFVYEEPVKMLTETEKELYKLVGDELSIAPNSTLSDWHRKGLERLADMILKREAYLSGSLSKQAIITQSGLPMGNQKRSIKIWESKTVRRLIPFLGVLLLGVLLIGGIKVWQIYKQALVVRQDVSKMQALITAPGSKLDRIKSAGPELSSLRQDFETLKHETDPFLWMGPLLGWVPVYGGDLASVQALVDMADSLLVSADLSYQAVLPMLSGSGTSGFTPTHLTEMLVQAQPHLIEADRQINLARTARSHLAIERLDPRARDLIQKYVDPLLPIMSDGLSIAEDLPRLMGATGEGPKSYMILVENEDELRPTGGFITAVGNLLLDNGRISDLTFVNSYDLDDWSKPYPAAPWQLQMYMESSVMLLRDTSWFTNFPTAALYAETLNSYVNDRTSDGVISFDQQFLVEILQAVGPIKLEGYTDPINSGNVISYIRAEKAPSAADIVSQTNIKKLTIMNQIAGALMDKLLNGNIPAENLVSTLLQALDEHHLLIKIDSPSISAILNQRRWDGAVRPDQGDFLMVVDTNVGFNKTNTMVQSNQVYDVDLTKVTSPTSSLTVIHKNNSIPVLCRQSHKISLPGEKYYVINDCYWNYMRVYMTSGTKLLDAVPQFVPANWTMIKQDIPARVDNLDEGINGVQAFGTLQVVPGSESVVTSFHFGLPSSIIQTKAGQSIYHLLVQKQPGTLAIPITIRVHLPNNATLITAPSGAVIQSPNILYQTTLRTDLDIEIGFMIP